MRKLSLYFMLSLIVIFSGLSIIGYRKYTSSIPTVIYKVGSSSSTVKELEEKLKWLGFFNGKPDNYYGYDTFNAVKKVQKERGLKADGIAGDKTLITLGISVDKKDSDKKDSDKNEKVDTSINQSDEILLAKAINGESRGEPYEGQVAVGAVIMNRVVSSKFPNTIPGVIYEPKAFSSTMDGEINKALEESPKKAARDAINGWDPTGGCLYFYNPDKTKNKWILSRTIVKVIGKHRFAK